MMTKCTDDAIAAGLFSVRPSSRFHTLPRDLTWSTSKGRQLVNRKWSRTPSHHSTGVSVEFLAIFVNSSSTFIGFLPFLDLFRKVLHQICSCILINVSYDGQLRIFIFQELVV